MTFDTLLAIASSGLAVLAAVATTSFLASTSGAAKRQFVQLQKVRVNDILVDPSVRSLGGLLVDNLGRTSLPSYVRDPMARKEFRRAFNAVRAFVGTDVEVLDEVQPVNGTEDIDDSVVAWARPLTSAGQKALREVNSGETWNALALMRREVETALSALLLTSEEERPRVGAGQLASLAAKQGVISPQVAAELRYPISVANAAIHGEEVSADAALEAIFIMDRVINEISGATN